MLVCWRLDRLGRNLKHLVTLIDELQQLGIAFISLGASIDCTTPPGKLQPHILAALAEFERPESASASLPTSRASTSGLDASPTPSRMPDSRQLHICHCVRWRSSLESRAPSSTVGGCHANLFHARAYFRPGFSGNSTIVMRRVTRQLVL